MEWPRFKDPAEFLKALESKDACGGGYQRAHDQSARYIARGPFSLRDVITDPEACIEDRFWLLQAFVDKETFNIAEAEEERNSGVAAGECYYAWKRRLEERGEEIITFYVRHIEENA